MSEIRTDSLVNQSGDNDSGIDLSTNDVVAIKTANSEALRVDSSGDLLVGKTQVDVTATGTEIRNSGLVRATRSGGTVLLVNRQTSDGTVIDVRKSDGSVGYIGANGGEIYVTDATYGGFGFSTHATSKITPCDSAGANKDNVLDLGHSDSRWDDIFATNGTIQTSDQNEKQQIASLTDAEITAAKAISQLFKTFKWNDRVAAKGDAARTHTGVIAQDVEAAMTAAGLDAGDYAFFISTTWWEADGETYYNADDAPEGATEHNRKGIRYPELLSFVGAATEQRLANIETRLAALENA